MSKVVREVGGRKVVCVDKDMTTLQLALKNMSDENVARKGPTVTAKWPESMKSRHTPPREGHPEPLGPPAWVNSFVAELSAAEGVKCVDVPLSTSTPGSEASRPGRKGRGASLVHQATQQTAGSQGATSASTHSGSGM